ncbi:hypothetical protein A4X03_0g8919 [Tilletia caries]|uniref:HTH CENPB-type domain-containing protein n=1 Tax=Tilletia caries TaxID=13290 RepID=A0A8T8SE86_9BASI|nr:hypothetical protein A4X03_0g8919 [Tilletia caries]
MSSTYKETEEQLECALEEVRACKGKPNFAKIAKKWKVHRQRLSRRFQGKTQSKSTRPPTNRKLNSAQEQALMAYVAALDRLELSARPALLVASANQLLAAAHQGSGPPPVVGKNWLGSFVKRHPQLHRVKQKSRELSRMLQDRPTLKRFFGKLKKTMDEHGITQDDIWNVDEVGFRIGAGEKQWIVTLNPSKDAHLASETRRDSVTCIEAVSAAGQHIAPLIIFAAAQHSESWSNNDLSDDTLLAVSANGYTDDILALRWIKHFNELTLKITKGNKRLLIFDGHGSHCTKQFLEYCEQSNIIPFSLPPHSSHILQPLDVSVFQPMKHWHREAIDKATRSGCTNFNKIEFLAALTSIRKAMMQPNTIKAGFRLTGLFPFNPEMILVKFPEHSNDSGPATGSSSLPTATISTPKTLRSLSRTVNVLERRNDLSPTVIKCIRGAHIQAQAGSLAVTALEVQTAAQQERNARAERQRKVVQSGGVLYSGQARSITQEKLQQEEAEERRREFVKVRRTANKSKAEGWRQVFAQMRKVVKARAKAKSGVSAATTDTLEDLDNDADEGDNDLDLLLLP